MTGDRLPEWLNKHVAFASALLGKDPTARRSSRPTLAHNRGFAADAAQGLKDLDARSVPLGVEAQPAYQPSYAPNARLLPEHAAGGGLITDDRGYKRPHYHGHRERLRQRFISGGHDPMPEYELLELVLFNAIPRIDVKPLAKRLLAEFGDLSGVVAASEHRLLQVAGTTPKVYVQLKVAEAMAQRITKAKAIKRDVLSSWSNLVDYCRTAMAHRETEQFRVLYLDRKNHILADEAQAEGTVDHVPVYPREIAKRALELNASALILVHNHPSGDTSPSDTDIAMTDEICAAVSVLGVTVHDHIIVGKAKEFSFKQSQLLD